MGLMLSLVLLHRSLGPRRDLLGLAVHVFYKCRHTLDGIFKVTLGDRPLDCANAS
jgi:hypothetical protein